MVLECGHVGEQPLGPLAGQVQGGVERAGQVARDDAGGLMTLDGAAARGQRHAGAHLKRPVFR